MKHVLSIILRILTLFLLCVVLFPALSNFAVPSAHAATLKSTSSGPTHAASKGRAACGPALIPASFVEGQDEAGNYAWIELGYDSCTGQNYGEVHFLQPYSGNICVSRQSGPDGGAEGPVCFPAAGGSAYGFDSPYLYSPHNKARASFTRSWGGYDLFLQTNWF